jgi:hypothetical protein
MSVHGKRQKPFFEKSSQEKRVRNTRGYWATLLYKLLAARKRNMCCADL